MLDLGSADAEGEGAEGAVGGGVGIAADDGRARQGETLFGTDDVDDTLARIVHREVRDVEVGAVLVQGLDLEARFVIFDTGRAVRRRHIVVGDGQGGIGTANLAPGIAQALESLRAGHLVHQMTIDIQQVRAVVLGIDDMTVPDLVEQGLRLGHG